MLLKLRTEEGGQINVALVREDGEDSRAPWKSLPPDPPIQLLRDLNGSIEYRIAEELMDQREEIVEQFLAQLAGAALQEAGGLEFSDDDGDVTGEEDPFPYDPETIRVDTKPFNISLVYDMINDGDINLSPDFQRQFVWTDLGARSRLIESIMLRIPLPVFYMAQDRQGRLQVVDGLQRLTVIKQFLDNELKLRDLEYLKDEEGKTFRHNDPRRCIDQRYRKRIMQTQIMMNIIDPQTPTDVKFDIFKRINQGGRPLNAQEIRNCMSQPATRALIGELSRSNEFLLATGGSVGTVRMQDQELVLRFLAFRLVNKGVSDAYQGNMDRFLDHAIDILNNASEGLKSELDDEFRRAMLNAAHLFGAFAFRKCLPDDLRPGARRRLINNALFTAWSATLSDYHPASVELEEAGSFAVILAHQLSEDQQLLDSVTAGTNDKRRISYAMSAARRICEDQFL